MIAMAKPKREETTMNVIEYKRPCTGINLTRTNSVSIEKIAEKLGITPEEVVNNMIYILTSEVSGIKDDLEIFCENNINAKNKMKEDVLLQYRAKYLQQIENYASLQEMFGALSQ